MYLFLKVCHGDQSFRGNGFKNEPTKSLIIGMEEVTDVDLLELL
jgi:hypothetical protein